MLVHPRIHRRAAHIIVVVPEVQRRFEENVVGRAEQLIMLLQFGKTLRLHLLRPVIRRRHPLRPGREHRGELDVPRVHSQQRRILTGAAALHRRRDHHRRKRHRWPRINRPQQKRLRPAAARARHAHARRIHVRQREQKIQRPHRVQTLQSHHALQPRLRLRPVKPPDLRRVHLRPLLAEPMHQLKRKLQAVRIPQHVVVKNHAPHPRQRRAPRLQRTPPAVLESLRAIDNLAQNLLRPRVREPSLRPMSMRTQHPRQFPRLALGPVQIPRHKKPRRALKENPLHREIPAVDPPVNHRVQRRLLRHRPQPLRHQNLPAHILRALRPRRGRGRRRERKIAVQILQRPEPPIRRQLPLGQRAQRLGRRGDHHRRRQEAEEQRRPPGTRVERGRGDGHQFGHRKNELSISCCRERAALCPSPPAIPVDFQNASGRGCD